MARDAAERGAMAAELPPLEGTGRSTTTSRAGDGELRGATVLLAGEGKLLLATDDGQLEAERAASCLLEPTAGDRVLVASVDGQAFVLAVLRREASAPARIDVEGGLELRARSGRVALVGREVELTASEQARVTAPRLDLSVLAATLFADALAYVGSRVEAEVGKVSLVADVVDTVAERLRQRLQRSYRFVEGLDQVRSGTLDAKATVYARIHAPDTVLTADKLVKIDGEQIHVG